MDTTNDLLKKQNNINRLMVFFLLIIMVAILITCFIVAKNVVALQYTIAKIDGIVDDLAVATDELADVNWDDITSELETVSRELSTVDWQALSKDVSDTAVQAQESLKVAGEAITDLDIPTLNQAIKDLQTVIEPLAKVVGRFG